MMVSIDRAGRVVIPKEFRDRLDLRADAELEITIDGEGLRLTPPARRRRRLVEVDGWTVIEADERRSITDADVQRWRDADQR